MNHENLLFLQDNLKYLGFGELGPLNNQLEESIGSGVAEFQLYTEACFDENTKLEACLHFRRGDKNEMYFFNKYEALLRYEDRPGKDMGHTFYINKGAGITFKEAFNLLQGRAVNKDLTNQEGEKYNAWLQLQLEEKDGEKTYRLKPYGARYGYDIEKVLEKYPIRELQLEETKKTLIRSLRRGNLQMVTFIKTGKTVKMMIEANPLYKTINIHPLTARQPARSNKKANPSEVEPATVPGPDPDNEGDKEEEKEVMEETLSLPDPPPMKPSPRKRIYK